MHPTTPRWWLWPLVALGVALAGVGVYFAVVQGPSPPPQNPGPGPAGPGGEVPAGPPWFRDVGAGSGLDFTYKNGEEADRYTILESLGGGVALLDHDGDGRLDVFVTGGGTIGDRQFTGHPCKLFRNLGDWKFEDVSKEVGLDSVAWWYTHGAAVADYDRDGWPDLLVTGYGRLALFRNEPRDGGRRFVDVTAKAGLGDTSWSTSAGWGDLDGDGYPDLYVCHYVDWSFTNDPICKGHGSVERDVCPPQRFKPLRHVLYRNKGDGTFRDATEEQKLRADGCGLGVVLADFIGEGRPGVYVANDATDNHLYLNRGGKLEEKAGLAGVAVDDNGLYNGSMGVDAADYDGSGRASLFVTNFQGELHALYQNLGRERFAHQSKATGIAALGRAYVGFGTAFVDADNDGWEDLVLVNGHVLRHPQGSTLAQKPVVLRNTDAGGRRVFRDYSSRGGSYFEKPAVARGLAVGDLDNDGWPDLVVSHSNSPVALLRNEAAADRPPHRWLGLVLAGKGHRDVVGSTVTVELKGGRKLTRFARGGGSYLSSSDRRMLVGLGPKDEVASVTVRWSWGEEQRWEKLEPGAYWELREGETNARRVR